MGDIMKYSERLCHQIQEFADTINSDIGHAEDKKNAGMECVDISTYIEQMSRTLEMVFKLQKMFSDESEKSKTEVMGLKVLDEERNRVARELHDSTVQNLSCLMYKAELCSKLLTSDPTRVQLELQLMIGSIKEIIEELRNIIYNIRTGIPDGEVITDYVKKYIQSLNGNYPNISFSFKASGEPFASSKESDTSMICVIREAINNSIKHSEATSVSVSFSYKKDALKIEIVDNGKGFDVKKTKKAEGKNFGMYIMEERVRMLGGYLQFNSAKEKGTKVTIDLPNLISEGMKDDASKSTIS